MADQTVDLLEDTDGAPYPEAVQDFVKKWDPANFTGISTRFGDDLVAALESVADHYRSGDQAYSDGQSSGYADWTGELGDVLPDHVELMPRKVADWIRFHLPCAIFEPVDDLRRLNTIGLARRDEIDDEDWDWFTHHPLNQGTGRRVLLSEVIPDFITWLENRGRAEGDNPPPVHRFKATVRIYGDTHAELLERVHALATNWWHWHVRYGERDEIGFSTDGTTTVYLDQPNPTQTPEGYSQELDAWSEVRKAAKSDG